MVRQRLGEKNVRVPGWGVRISQPSAAPPIVWSLYFDGGDWVDCGNGPSVMNLHAGDFTCDVYFRTPAAGLWANFQQYYLISQGDPGLVQGWYIYVNPIVLPNANIYLYIVDGGGVARLSWRNINPILFETWYYIRARRFGNVMALSVNAGAEDQDPVVGATLCARNLFLARRGAAAIQRLIGSEVYVHLWNNDQGALGAVPATPFAIGANTAARYRFTDAAGAVLTDDSGNGNNGTIVGAAWQALGPPGWTP